MRKIYIKPDMEILIKVSESALMSGSTHDPNQVVDENGTFTGGTSSESDGEDNGNGAVGDMAKGFSAWSSWDD